MNSWYFHGFFTVKSEWDSWDFHGFFQGGIHGIFIAFQCHENQAETRSFFHGKFMGSGSTRWKLFSHFFSSGIFSWFFSWYFTMDFHGILLTILLNFHGLRQIHGFFNPMIFFYYSWDFHGAFHWQKNMKIFMGNFMGLTCSSGEASPHESLFRRGSQL